MRTIGVICTALAAACSLASAQQTPSKADWLPPVGSRIRVTSIGLGADRMTGTLMAAVSDTIAVQPEGVAWSASIKTSDLIKLEISQGTHTSFLKGLGIGLVAGAVVAGGLTAATWHPTGDFDFGRWGDAAFLGAAGALGGAVIGAVVGAVPKETWRAVRLPAR